MPEDDNKTTTRSITMYCIMIGCAFTVLSGLALDVGNLQYTAAALGSVSLVSLFSGIMHWIHNV